MLYRVPRFNGRRWEQTVISFEASLHYGQQRAKFRALFREEVPLWLGRFKVEDRIRILDYANEYRIHPQDQCIELLKRKPRVLHPNGRLHRPQGSSADYMLYLWLDQSPSDRLDKDKESACSQAVSKVVAAQGFSCVGSFEPSDYLIKALWVLGMEESARALFDATPVRACMMLSRKGVRQDYWYDVPIGPGDFPSIHPKIFKWGSFDELVDGTFEFEEA